MKNKKIKLLLIALAVLTVASGLVLLSGCDKTNVSSGSSDPTEIFIASSDLPRVKYVEGQELELKGGVLTVVVGGSPERMPLDNEAVSVTGYDKNTLGKQTLTVTYKGLTATYDIEVVARLSAENYETEYFVGDTFDNSKGRLWITGDDGSAKQVAMNSESVTLKSFDSSKGGKANVVLTCTDGDKTYDCSFEVNVYEIGSIVPSFPKKTNYASHEKEINLTGAYLTVKAKAPATLSKYVPITADMISGYDPSSVTAANKDIPVKQTVVITYGDQSFSFEVSVSYSPIYLIEDVAGELGNLDFTGDKLPEISEEKGSAAADAMIIYLELAPSERALINEDDALKIARTATVYLYEKYLEASKAYSDAFIVNGDGTMSIVAKSYDAMADAIERLEDPNDLFNYYAEVLCEVNEVFGDKILCGTATFSSAVLVHTPESMENIIPMFEYMLLMYDNLKSIPDNWTENDLKIYADDIEYATDRMIISDYLGMDYFYLYSTVSTWRTNDDYLDIIYTYFMNIKATGQTEIQQRLWNKIPAPGLIGDWYVNYVYAETARYTILQNVQKAYLYDTIGMIYYFKQAKNIEKAVLEGDNELYKDLYDLMECGKDLDLVAYGQYGYAFQMGEALGNKSVMEAWDKYLALVESYINDPGFSIEGNADEFEAAFNALAELSPAELHAFASSMNFLYDQVRGAVLVLDCKQYVYNTYMSLVASYYVQRLPENARPLFPVLMNAMENYSLQNIKDGAVDDFKTNMAELTAGVKGLSEADRKVFMELLGDCYDKYVAIYGMVQSPDSITLTADQQKLFDELWNAMNRFDEVVAYLNDSSVSAENKNRATPLLFASYEKLESLYEQIAATDAELAMYVKLYSAEGITITLDRRFFGARALFVNVMLTEISTEDITTRIINIYGGDSFKAFLAAAEGIMYAEMKGAAYTGNDIAEVMACFRALSKEDKITVYSLGVNQMYYAGIERYMTAAFGEGSNEAELAKTLIEAEIAYVMGESEKLNTLISKAESLYGAISNKDAFNKIMGDVYSFYTNIQ